MKESTHIDPALMAKVQDLLKLPPKERPRIQEIFLLLYLGEEGFAEFKKELSK